MLNKQLQLFFREDPLARLVVRNREVNHLVSLPSLQRVWSPGTRSARDNVIQLFCFVLRKINRALREDRTFSRS